VAYFTEARFCRQYPVLGIESGQGAVVAAANVNPPQRLPAPESLKQSYARLCETLGAPAMARYEAFAAACAPFEPEAPHYHLGMIGVVGAERGRGHARRLLDAVHAMSREEPASAGVSLTTETPRNLPLYEHFGYRVVGHGLTPDAGLETWTLFRADDG
jgi:GNAT superfamily N-acetyltransferase